MIGLENYTIIMSVYSKVNPAYLERSIKSILNQTHKTSEFIIIKDGELTNSQNEVINNIVKTDESIFKIIELPQNMGSGVAYNKGIAICTNKWAAIMDSDDIADCTKFEKQMDFLKKHNDIDILGSNAIEFINQIDNITSIRIMPEENKEIIKFAHRRCPFIQPTVVFKVSSVKMCGGYRHSPLTEDYDLYIRMIKKGCKFYTYQEVLYYVRISNDFFKRRGGIKYLTKILSFKFRHYKSGFFTLNEFLITTIASFIVCILPNFLRIYIYIKFLRD